MNIKLKIDGMTCASCELRICNALKKLVGIKDAKASFANSIVSIEYDESIVNVKTIVNTITKTGYEVVRNKKEQTKDTLSISNLIGIGIIIFAIYIIINHTIGFNFIPSVDQSMGYGLLFVVGLLTSLHCIAMCGGINLSQCISHNDKCSDNSKISKLQPSILYNLGRVISYTIIGGIVGAIGSVVSFSGTAKGIVAILSGIFMVIMGLNMLSTIPFLRKLNIKMPKLFGNKIYNNNGKDGPLYIGLLNGLMPCGPLQAMQLYALGTGSFFAGATSMFFFSIGTVPVMFGLGALSSLLSAKFTKSMLKVSAVLVITLGVLMVGRGLNLSGINTAQASINNTTTSSIAKIEGGVQVVTTSLDGGKYLPIVVQKGIPVKWTINAKQSDLNGCDNPVTIPKYNITKKLVAGDNVIEFTPQEEGDITYTCWMGMISSNIKVVGNISTATPKDLEQSNNNVQAPTGNQKGCCGR